MNDTIEFVHKYYTPIEQLGNPEEEAALLIDGLNSLNRDQFISANKANYPVNALADLWANVSGERNTNEAFNVGTSYDFIDWDGFESTFKEHAESPSFESLPLWFNDGGELSVVIKATDANTATGLEVSVEFNDGESSLVTKEQVQKEVKSFFESNENLPQLLNESEQDKFYNQYVIEAIMKAAQEQLSAVEFSNFIDDWEQTQEESGSDNLEASVINSILERHNLLSALYECEGVATLSNVAAPYQSFPPMVADVLKTKTKPELVNSPQQLTEGHNYIVNGKAARYESNRLGGKFNTEAIYEFFDLETRETFTLPKGAKIQRNDLFEDLNKSGISLGRLIDVYENIHESTTSGFKVGDHVGNNLRNGVPVAGSGAWYGTVTKVDGDEITVLLTNNYEIKSSSKELKHMDKKEAQARFNVSESLSRYDISDMNAILKAHFNVEIPKDICEAYKLKENFKAVIGDYVYKVEVISDELLQFLPNTKTKKALKSTKKSPKANPELLTSEEIKQITGMACQYQPESKEAGYVFKFGKKLTDGYIIDKLKKTYLTAVNEELDINLDFDDKGQDDSKIAKQKFDKAKADVETRVRELKAECKNEVEKLNKKIQNIQSSYKQKYTDLNKNRLDAEKKTDTPEQTEAVRDQEMRDREALQEQENKLVYDIRLQQVKIEDDYDKKIAALYLGLKDLSDEQKKQVDQQLKEKQKENKEKTNALSKEMTATIQGLKDYLNPEGFLSLKMNTSLELPMTKAKAIYESKGATGVDDIVACICEALISSARNSGSKSVRLGDIHEMLIAEGIFGKQNQEILGKVEESLTKGGELNVVLEMNESKSRKIKQFISSKKSAKRPVNVSESHVETNEVDVDNSAVVKLLEKLASLTEKHGADANPKEISYNNDLQDEVLIGYFNEKPDGDYQQQLADEGFTFTKEEATTALENRIENFSKSLGIEETNESRKAEGTDADDKKIDALCAELADLIPQASTQYLVSTANDLLDEVAVGYYGDEPDGDYQQQLADDGFTYKSAQDVIETLEAKLLILYQDIVNNKEDTSESVQPKKRRNSLLDVSEEQVGWQKLLSNRIIDMAYRAKSEDEFSQMLSKYNDEVGNHSNWKATWDNAIERLKAFGLKGEKASAKELYDVVKGAGSLKQTFVSLNESNDKESIQYIVDTIRDFAFDVYNKYDANELMELLESLNGDLKVNSISGIVGKLRYFGVKKREMLEIAEMLEQPEQGMFMDAVKPAFSSRTRVSTSNADMSEGASGIPLPGSNLYLYGQGLDTNGNRVIKVGFPNRRGFSIQVAGNLLGTERIIRGGIKVSELSDADLATIGKEAAAYVKEHGSEEQKKVLRGEATSTNVKEDDVSEDYKQISAIANTSASMIRAWNNKNPNQQVEFIDYFPEKTDKETDAMQYDKSLQKSDPFTWTKARISTAKKNQQKWIDKLDVEKNEFISNLEKLYAEKVAAGMEEVTNLNEYMIFIKTNFVGIPTKLYNDEIVASFEKVGKKVVDTDESSQTNEAFKIGSKVLLDGKELTIEATIEGAKTNKPNKQNGIMTTGYVSKPPVYVLSDGQMVKGNRLKLVSESVQPRVKRKNSLQNVNEASEDKIEEWGSDIKTLANGWAVVVAEDGEKEAKRQFKSLWTKLKKAGQKVTDKYPDGALIESTNESVEFATDKKAELFGVSKEDFDELQNEFRQYFKTSYLSGEDRMLKFKPQLFPMQMIGDKIYVAVAKDSVATSNKFSSEYLASKAEPLGYIEILSKIEKYAEGHNFDIKEKEFGKDYKVFELSRPVDTDESVINTEELATLTFLGE